MIFHTRFQKLHNFIQMPFFFFRKIITQQFFLMINIFFNSNNIGNNNSSEELKRRKKKISWNPQLDENLILLKFQSLNTMYFKTNNCLYERIYLFTLTYPKKRVTLSIQLHPT